MSSNQRAAEKKIAEALASVRSLVDEIEALVSVMAGDTRPCAKPAGSSWGLSCPVVGRVTPVVVPDSWINEWAVMCGGRKDWVLAQVREAIVWCGDNPSRLKTEKGLRRFFGSWIRSNWKRDMANRPQPTGSLDGYERRNPVND